MHRFMLVWVILIGGLLSGCGGGSGALTANAGTDFTIQVGEQPRFDGCASTGDVVNYKWIIITAPDKMSSDAGKVIREIEPNCAFTLDAQMGVDEVGRWDIELEVRDEAGNTAVDTVVVTVIE